MAAKPPSPRGALKGQVACHPTDFHPCKSIMEERNVPETTQLLRTLVLNSVKGRGLVPDPLPREAHAQV